MEKYKCDICSKKHSFFNNVTGGSPHKVIEILKQEDEEEEKRRIQRFEGNAILLDKKYVFISGEFAIETLFSEYPITHVIWLEFPINSYLAQVESAKGNPTLTLVGKTASETLFYQQSLGLEAKWILHKARSVGKIEIISESQLRTDQKDPITKERLIEMMQRIHHPELWKEKKQFDNSFEQRLADILENAEKNFHYKEKYFVINISNPREVLFQFVSASMLNIKPTGKIGLYLSNDDINDNYDYVKEKMKNLSKSNSIKLIELDRIETYQKNYEFEINQILVDIVSLVKNVFDENLEELDIDIFEP